MLDELTSSVSVGSVKVDSEECNSEDQNRYTNGCPPGSSEIDMDMFQHGFHKSRWTPAVVKTHLFQETQMFIDRWRYRASHLVEERR